MFICWHSVRPNCVFFLEEGGGGCGKVRNNLMHAINQVGLVESSIGSVEWPTDSVGEPYFSREMIITAAENAAATIATGQRRKKAIANNNTANCRRERATKKKSSSNGCCRGAFGNNAHNMSMFSAVFGQHFRCEHQQKKITETPKMNYSCRCARLWTRDIHP